MLDLPPRQIESYSLAEQCALLSEAERATLFQAIRTDAEWRALEQDWAFWARPNQLAPPGTWTYWILNAGRGAGKTRAGAEWINQKAAQPGLHLALVAESAAEVRDVMIEGTSGILACGKIHNQPSYEPSKRRIVWPNGTWATTYSGDSPDQLRGPHISFAWCDELAKYKWPEATLTQLEMVLRAGEHPQMCITTTPRPIPVLKELMSQANQDAGISIVRTWSTYENMNNLAPSFIQLILRKYEGTRLGRQELHAELLTEAEGALWSFALLEEHRVRQHPDLIRIVVGVDPHASTGETGIVVVGKGEDGHGYVLDDATTGGSPSTWASQAITMFHKHKADRIIAESNNGGDMVISTLAQIDKQVPTKKVWASRGKYARAEPISALYEQGVMHHLGVHAALEDEMCSWVPGQGMASPNRCLAAGTRIATEHGIFPIENIRPGQRVWTRHGLKPVLASRQTDEAAQTITVAFSNGATLTGTPDHLIFTQNRGLVSLGALVWDDIIYQCPKRYTFSTAFDSCVIRKGKQKRHVAIFPHHGQMHKKALSSCIARYGKLRMGQSLRDFISTILTAIRSIITLPIWSAFLRKNMRNDMRKNMPKRDDNIWQQFGRKLPPGIPRLKGEPGIVSRGEQAGKIVQQWNMCVHTAEFLLRPWCAAITPNGFVPAFATPDGMKNRSDIMNRGPVLSVTPSFSLAPINLSASVPVHVSGRFVDKKQPVYDLTVADCPEYYAEGILVHNCDALVWACHELFLEQQFSAKQKRVVMG